MSLQSVPPLRTQEVSLPKAKPPTTTDVRQWWGNSSAAQTGAVATQLELSTEVVAHWNATDWEKVTDYYARVERGMILGRFVNVRG